MKFLLICFLAVQITAVFCTYRRHGQASFLLRKVCEELAGMKGKVAGLEEEVAELKEEVAGLKEENSAMKQPG